MANLPIKANSPEVGQCIYCGQTKVPLSNEHAIPYGLNGPWTLVRASCQRCADITHRFERDTLRDLFGPFRTVMKMQSRRSNLRPKSLPLILSSEREQSTIEVPLDDYPLYLPVPVLPQPGWISGERRRASWTPELEFLHVAGPSFSEVANREGVNFVGARLTFSAVDFSRTLAKIAYAAAVRELSVAPFVASPIRQAILNRDTSVYDFVGSWSGDPQNLGKGLHQVKVLCRGTSIEVVVRLFAQFGAPEYHVLLGAADPAFVRSDRWPWR